MSDEIDDGEVDILVANVLFEIIICSTSEWSFAEQTFIEEDAQTPKIYWPAVPLSGKYFWR